MPGCGRTSRACRVDTPLDPPGVAMSGDAERKTVFATYGCKMRSYSCAGPNGRESTMLLSHWKTALATALWVAACSQPGLAQVQPPTILEIDTENVVQYFEDTSDVSKFATDPNVTTAVVPKNLNRASIFGDIVAVNGQRVMGAHTRAAIGSIFLNTVPSPGQAIADTVRNAVGVATFEILKRDGTP